MTLGEKLKEARKQAGLSQEQLAEQLIISRSARIFLDYPVSALLNRVKHRLNNAK